MKKIYRIFIFSCILLYACNQEPDKLQMEKWKQEIMEVEGAFAEMVSVDGLEAGFYHFADDNGVIKRNGKIIQGKEAIKDFYHKPEPEDDGTTLQWKPDFIEVSSSGDLAYTYGGYVFTFIDSTGSQIENTGYFHTVWKRQENGSWKYVYD